jgi:hypothetical protein
VALNFSSACADLKVGATSARADRVRDIEVESSTFPRLVDFLGSSEMSLSHFIIINII